MADIAELRDKINTKTLNLVLLSIATGGIYLILWLSRNYPVIDALTKKKTADDTYIIWISVCTGVGMTVAFFLGFLLTLAGVDIETSRGAALFNEIFDMFTSVFQLAASVLLIIWAFRARTALQEYYLSEHKIDLKMNRFYTFVFNVYYINYCINDLPEAQRKQAILSGHNPVSSPATGSGR